MDNGIDVGIWFWVAFNAGVLVILALDLGVFHRSAHAPSVKEAAMWSAVWVALSLAFAGVIFVYGGTEPGFAFLTGYVVEYSLSVDNIFVFIVVLGYFGVPARHQHRVLFYGILGALVFRALFIALGSLLMQFHWVVWVFGAFLIFTGIKMLSASESAVDPERNLLIRMVRRFLPVTPEFHGRRFFVHQNGRLFATPLLVALLCLEATDIVFAVDSVPAIYALTSEPLVVFTSNIFAILGLRSMYFMLGGAVEKFHLLRYGLAVVLIFVGLKMVWLDGWYGGKFPITTSLEIIGAVLATSVIASFLLPKRPTPAAVALPSEKM